MSAAIARWPSSSITVTSNTYGHVVERRQRQVAEGLDAVLGG